ncbi:MAG: ABC transporter permease [SAR202 cluster bacterium]|jgi:peptide/nickel transport system permease protein|nr:peptide ABC transporter permease [Chloroflexota bacterium]MQG84331.1 ABC transporter permease [SAR202 cluster bacterium]|tara:strand:- start:741 stop:1700 length:960 start_codon:yes stop_codon:yes gene_type:complete
MQTFIIRRLLFMIPTLLGATLFVFLLMRVVPGDIAYALLAGEEGAAAVDPASLEKLREELGTNNPLYQQYWDWIKGIPMGDLGNSMWNRLPVADEIMIRMPITGQLAIMSVIIGCLVGIPLGIISALKQDTWIDAIARFFSIFFLALPAFWEGLMILMLTVRVWRWMPPLGRNYLWEDPGANMAQLIFPALIIGFNLMAIVTRMTRSTMLEVLREDYIRTARAKGLANTVVIWRHVLKNSMIPVVTVVSMSVGGLLGGTVVSETVFSIPGIGVHLIEAIRNRDYTTVQALILVFAFIFVFINLLVDIIYGWLDPRISNN